MSVASWSCVVPSVMCVCSFMVMCRTLNDVCLHVGLLLVRTALATTLYATSRISTAFTHAGSPHNDHHQSSYTTHINLVESLWLLVSQDAGRTTFHYSGLHAHHCFVLSSSPCPVCQSWSQLPGEAPPPCGDL